MIPEPRLRHPDRYGSTSAQGCRPQPGVAAQLPQIERLSDPTTTCLEQISHATAQRRKVYLLETRQRFAPLREKNLLPSRAKTQLDANLFPQEYLNPDESLYK